VVPSSSHCYKTQVYDISSICLCAEAEDRIHMTGKDGSARVFPLPAYYYCITLQFPLACLNKSKALDIREDYHVVIILNMCM
jgi:hypothetical protein